MSATRLSAPATVRTGIGGWTYPPWRGGMFYPPGLKHADELAFASRAVRCIEINATFHKLQKPESFRSWAAQVPDDFVFAVKGSRFVTNRKFLAEASEPIGRFMAQGLSELGPRLGPIVWQLMATKRFDPNDIAAFFALLPRDLDGRPLRHALEVGHDSFACAEFVALAKDAGVAIVWSEADNRVAIGDRTAPFAYARLQGMTSDCVTGYPSDDLARISAVAKGWAQGEAPAGLNYATDPAASAIPTEDVFIILINGAKERAPAAAQALAKLL